MNHEVMKPMCSMNTDAGTDIYCTRPVDSPEVSSSMFCCHWGFIVIAGTCAFRSEQQERWTCHGFNGLKSEVREKITCCLPVGQQRRREVQA